MAGDGAVDGARLDVGQDERVAVGLDEHVDLVDVNPMRMFGQESSGTGELRVHLDDEQTVRIDGRRSNGVHGGPGMQRQGEEAVGVGGRSHRRHDAGGELLGNAGETTEVRRNELHPCATVDKESFRRSEESREVTDPRLGEHGVEVDEQGTEDGEFGPVVSVAECMKKGRGLTGPEGDAEAVGRSEQRRSITRSHALRHHARTLRAGGRPSTPGRAPCPKCFEQLGSMLRCDCFDVVGAEMAGQRDDRPELLQDLCTERALGDVSLEAVAVCGRHGGLEIFRDPLDQFLTHHLA